MEHIKLRRMQWDIFTPPCADCNVSLVGLMAAFSHKYASLMKLPKRARLLANGGTTRAYGQSLGACVASVSRRVCGLQSWARGWARWPLITFLSVAARLGRLDLESQQPPACNLKENRKGCHSYCALTLSAIEKLGGVGPKYQSLIPTSARKALMIQWGKIFFLCCIHIFSPLWLEANHS